MREPGPDWSPFGVNFKILDEHPHLFYIRVPPPPRGSEWSDATISPDNGAFDRMTMTSGIMPPGNLNLSSTENMAENWKVWKQIWNNYMIIAKLCTQPPG